MKTILQTITIASCIGLIGCAVPHWEVDKPPTGKGYGTRLFWLEGTEASTPATDLHYWDDQKRDHLIWRDITFSWVLDSEHNLALFNCWLNKRNSSSKTETWDRLFAVEGAGPPVDISDAVKLIYIKINKIKLDSLDNYSVDLSKEKDRKFLFDVGRHGGDWGVITMTPEDILNLIHKGIEKGQLMKDVKTGLPYYKLD